MPTIVVDASDPLTGWATVGLAGVAVVTLVVSVITAILDRKNADRRLQEQRDHDQQRAQQERADAEARLVEERTAADQRLDDERAHTEKMRQRERQQDSAARLLERIATLLPFMKRVPKVYDATAFDLGPLRDDRAIDCERAVESLRFGGVADVPGLREKRAAEQYRKLVHLVLTAARGDHRQKDEPDASARQELAKLVAQDLWRYATFVRLSLEQLIEHGESLDPGQGGAGEPSVPILNRRPGDGSLWSPPNVPTSWSDAVSRDPDDPQYRPAK